MPSATLPRRFSTTAVPGEIQLQETGNASYPAAGVPGTFEYVINGTQTFSLNTESNLTLPLYLTGTLTVSDTNNANAIFYPCKSRPGSLPSRT